MLYFLTLKIIFLDMSVDNKTGVSSVRLPLTLSFVLMGLDQMFI